MASPTRQKIEDQFTAAVKVIQGLPKDGPFQPSKTMALKYYGLYKQATEGPCRIPKPGFWDVVSRAKYEAWNALGDMDSFEAKKVYVEELKKIIETMSFSNDVAFFTELLGTFYEYVPEGAENEPSRRDREASAANEGDQVNDNVSDSGVDTRDGELTKALGQYIENSSASGDEDNELSAKGDKLRTDMAELQRDMDLLHREKNHLLRTMTSQKTQNIKIDDDRASDSEGDIFEDPVGQIESDVMGTLHNAVAMLKRDVDNVKSRLSDLERKQKVIEKESAHRRTGMDTRTTIFFLVWPFVVQGLFSAIKRK